jgi:serine/threonine protein kinase
MSEFTPIRFGNYLLLEKIAVGGMAQLYRAKITGAKGFEKLIAIKTLLPHLIEEREVVNAFVEEAKLAALLNHQNIVQIYDFGLMENSYFIAMEYLFGKDLRHIFHKSKEKNILLSLGHALYVASRICSGLDYAHKLTDLQGKPLHIIHRDISPPNISITYEGEVKIVDFGIAKAAGKGAITQNGIIKGKAAYMSPEQASGEKIDPRSDIFSAGILLYEMATQKRMFTGDNLQILAKVRQAEFEPAEAVMPGLPPKVYLILRKALAKDLKQRYQSCGEMVTDIEECMFRLSWRPTTGSLADYMKKLFKEEIAAEGVVSRGTAAIPPKPRGAPRGNLKLVEENLEKAKVTWAVEESARRKKYKIFYLTLPLALAVIGLILVLGSKEKLVNALHPEAFRSLYSESPQKIETTALPETKNSGHAEAKALQEKAAALVEKKPSEARSLLLKAIELDPKSAQAHFQLGVAYTALKNLPKAMENYQKAVEHDPQFTDAYFNLGYIYARNRNFSKAEEMYIQAVKLAPSYLDEALFNLSMVQEKQGKRKQSIENLERALKANPRNEMARKFLNRLKRES